MLSVQTETPEGGVVVRKSAHVSGRLVTRPAVATGGKRTFAALGSNVAEGPSLLGRPHSLGGQQAVPPQLCFEPFRALRVGFGLHVA